MVLGNFEKNMTLCELKWGQGMSFSTSYQKSADTFKFIITQLSYISHQKKSEHLLPCEAD